MHILKRHVSFTHVGKYRSVTAAAPEFSKVQLSARDFSPGMCISNICTSNYVPLQKKRLKTFPHLRGLVLGDIISFPRIWYRLASCSS